MPIERDDDLEDVSELHLGPRRPGWLVVTMLAVGALVAASVARSGGGGPKATVSTTGVPARTAAATTIADTSSTPTPAPTPETSTTLTTLPFGVPTGVVVYLTPHGSGGAPDAIVAYDVDAGTEHVLALGRDIGWYIKALDGAAGTVVEGGGVVVVVDGRPRTIDDSGQNGGLDAPNGRVAPGPDGGIWVRGFEPPALELVDTAGARTGRRYPLVPGAELFGSMADGRPVVRGGDRHAAAIERDGTRTPLAGIPERPVEAGRYVEIRCDETQACTAYAHIDEETAIALGPTFDDLGQPIAYRVAPNGPPVAVSVRSFELYLLDLRTHTETAVLDGMVQAFWTGGDEVAVRFLPDGRGLVAQTRRGLAFVDASGRVLAEVPRFDSELLGIGRARAWAP